MMWDASYKPDFNQSEMGFVDALVELLKGNILIDITEEELRAKAVEAGVAADEVERVLEKVKDCQAVTTLIGNNLQIVPHTLRALKHSIEERTRQKCKKQTLRQKTITFCPECDE